MDSVPCRLEVPHGGHDHVYYAHCEGDRAGCVVRTTADHEFESACVEGVGGCDPRVPSRCDGTRLVTRCERGQPVAFDCASYGGRCDPATLTCVGVAEGRRCGANFVCAAGLACAEVPGRRGVRACRRAG